MLLNCSVGENSWQSLGVQGDPTSASVRKSVLNIHWKDWCWSWNSNTLATWREELTPWKRPCCWGRLKAEGMTEDEMVGWHHQLNGHEFEKAPGVGDGQESLGYCSLRGREGSDMTEWLNWTELNWETQAWTHLKRKYSKKWVTHGLLKHLQGGRMKCGESLT